MAEITVLPPQEVPHKLTAQKRSDTLGEHMRAFMNKNNASGFIPDEDNELAGDTIGGALLEVMFGPGMTLREIYALVKQLRVMSNHQMSDRAARYIAFNALGYSGVNAVESICGSSKLNTFVPNLTDNTKVQRMYEKRSATNRELPKVTDKALQDYRLRQKRSLLAEEQPHLTDSIRNVTVTKVTRPTGVEVEIHSTPTFNTNNPFVKRIAVRLQDGERFDVLVDVAKLEVGADVLPSRVLDVELGVSLCNLNHLLPLESTSAARSLVFNNSGLSETEYFNRKMRLYPAQ